MISKWQNWRKSTGAVTLDSEVLLGDDEGMPQACVANCDHFQTVAKGKIGAVIATLSAAKLREVSVAIRFALDL